MLIQQLLKEAKNPNTSPERLSQLGLLEIEVARAVAKNINTPSETLKTLSSSKDDTTRKYVAGNPNTPLEVFSKLAMQFPKEVLNNPLLPILLMSDANFLEQFPSASLKNMLKRPEMPVEFIEWAAQNADWKVCEGILQNEKATLSALHSLEQRFSDQVTKIQTHLAFSNSIVAPVWTTQALIEDVLAKRATYSLPDGRLRQIGWFSRDENSKAILPLLTYAKCEIASDPNTPIATLQTLARDMYDDVQICVASNPNTPIEVLQELTLASDTVRLSLAKNRSAPIQLLQVLANDSSPDVRRAVTENPISPIELRASILDGVGVKDHIENSIKTLIAFALSPFLRSRWVAAGNPKTPSEILHLLATDTNSDTRRLVANNNATAPDTLKLLVAPSEDNHIRTCAVTNPNIPIEILQQMIREQSFALDVAYHSDIPISILQVLATNTDARVRTNVAKNPSTSVETLCFMYEKESDLGVIGTIALNPNTPIEILEKIFVNHVNLHPELAQNPSASSELLIKLAQGKGLHIRNLVSLHPATPAEVLFHIVSRTNSIGRAYIAQNPKAPIQLLSQLAEDESYGVRAAVAQNPNTTTQSLSQLAEDEHEKVRQYVAKNMLTPISTLEKLATDSIVEIRQAVAKNPSTPTALLAILAQDAKVEVRWYVAIHTNTAIETLQLLARDKVAISSWIVKHPKAPIEALIQVDSSTRVPLETLQQLALEKSKWIRAGVAKNVHTPMALLQQLLTDKDADVRLEIALNRNSPLEILSTLAKDTNWEIRVGVAGNENASSDLLMLMASDENLKVRLEVAKNTQTPFVALQILAIDKDSKIQETALQNYALSREQRSQLLHNANLDFAVELEKLLGSISKSEEGLVAYLHPQAPTPILAKAGRHDDPLIRAAVALHPKTPENTLKVLCQDGDARVRATALARMKDTP